MLALQLFIRPLEPTLSFSTVGSQSSLAPMASQQSLQRRQGNLRNSTEETTSWKRPLLVTFRLLRAGRLTHTETLFLRKQPGISIPTLLGLVGLVSLRLKRLCRRVHLTLTIFTCRPVTFTGLSKERGMRSKLSSASYIKKERKLRSLERIRRLASASSAELQLRLRTACTLIWVLDCQATAVISWRLVKMCFSSQRMVFWASGLNRR